MIVIQAQFSYHVCAIDDIVQKREKHLTVIENMTQNILI